MCITKIMINYTPGQRKIIAKVALNYQRTFALDIRAASVGGMVRSADSEVIDRGENIVGRLIKPSQSDTVTWMIRSANPINRAAGIALVRKSMMRKERL